MNEGATSQSPLGLVAPSVHSFDVLPTTSVHDDPNVLEGDTVDVRNRLVGHTLTSVLLNRLDVRLNELVVVALRTLVPSGWDALRTPGLSSLTVSVGHIVLMGTCKQMTRLNTGSYITGMADVHAFGYWTLGKLIGVPVCRGLGSIYLEPSIPVEVLLTLPDSASSCRVQNRPGEQFLKRSNCLATHVRSSTVGSNHPWGVDSAARNLQCSTVYSTKLEVN